MSTRDDRPGLPVERGDAPETSRPTEPSGRGSWLAVGVVGLAVICCAGPALIAGGALAAGGGILGSPSVVLVGAVILATGIGVALLRQRRGAPRKKQKETHDRPL